MAKCLSVHPTKGLVGAILHLNMISLVRHYRSARSAGLPSMIKDLVKPVPQDAKEARSLVMGTTSSTEIPGAASRSPDVAAPPQASGNTRAAEGG